MGAAEGWQPEQEASAKQAKLAVPALQPAAPAGAAAGLPAADWQGFAAWHRAQRASSDTFGFCLSLVFHGITLSKWRALSAMDLWYYSLYTLATLACLVWQRSGRPSYTAWRDWVQAAIRLDVFLSPPRLRLMLHSVDVPPPALPGPQLLSAPAAALVLLSNTLVVHLLLLPVAHTLPLWPHAAVQLACAARVVYDVRTLCDTRMFSAPISRAIMEEIYSTLRLLLGLLSLAPAASSGARPDPACHCQRVVSLLQLLLGVGLSVALRATWDARAYRTFRARRAQQAPPTAAAKKGLGAAYDRVYDVLSQRLLLPAAAFCRQPSLWVLAAVAVWDVCGVVLWRA